MFAEVLTRDQAIAARYMAGRVGIIRTAERLKVSKSTLYRSWAKHGIPTLTDHPRRSWDRAKALKLAQVLAEHGPEATAENCGMSRSGVYLVLRRFDIPPPVGKGGPGRSRPRGGV
jgi:transcriptional regulator of acetoin/glycerol metabolism